MRTTWIESKRPPDVRAEGESGGPPGTGEGARSAPTNQSHDAHRRCGSSRRSTNACIALQEFPNQSVRALRQLELRYVTALFEHFGTRVGEERFDVLREA